MGPPAGAGTLHVTLLDLGCFPPHALAAGEDADEADAFLALWTTLTGHHELADAIAVVAEAYSKRIGRFLEHTEKGSLGQGP